MTFSRFFAAAATSTLAVAPFAFAGPAVATANVCLPDAGFDHCEYYTVTGGEEALTFPDDLRDSQTVQIEIWGAGGGGEWYHGTGGWRGSPGGGAGGYVKFETTPGDLGRTVYLTVGEGGKVNTGTEAFGGGGAGGSSDILGSGGGGLSGIFASSGWTDPLVIVGGGGGVSPGSLTTSPGGGGGSTGDGNQSDPSDADKSGRAGTNSAGGAAATDLTDCDVAPTAGSSLQGGTGGSDAAINIEGGGGGGGGYFGGGGGRCQVGGGTQNGAGGGGSGFFDDTVATLLDEGAGANGSMDGNNHGLGGQPYVVSAIDPSVGGGGDGGAINTAESADGDDGMIVVQWEVPLGPEDPSDPSTPDLASTGPGTNVAAVAMLALAAILGALPLIRRRRS